MRELVQILGQLDQFEDAKRAAELATAERTAAIEQERARIYAELSDALSAAGASDETVQLVAMEALNSAANTGDDTLRVWTRLAVCLPLAFAKRKGEAMRAATEAISLAE